MLAAILFIVLFFGILKAGLKLAWNLTKFALGLGLFFICPLAFFLAAAFGLLGWMWIPILIAALFMGRGFSLA